MNKEGLYIDSKNNRVFWDGKQVRLTAIQFRIVEIFYIWRQRRLYPDMIMDYVYHDFDEEPYYFPTISVHISNIRKRIPGIPLRSHMGKGGGFTLD